MTSSARHLDPTGKQALFQAPVQASPDQLEGERQGREALFSSGRRKPGTVVVECSKCSVRTRSSLLGLGLQLLPFTAWIPTRSHGHFMRCPSCGRFTWCKIGWTE